MATIKDWFLDEMQDQEVEIDGKRVGLKPIPYVTVRAAENKAARMKAEQESGLAPPVTETPEPDPEELAEARKRVPEVLEQETTSQRAARFELDYDMVTLIHHGVAYVGDRTKPKSGSWATEMPVARMRPIFVEIVERYIGDRLLDFAAGR